MSRCDLCQAEDEVRRYEDAFLCQKCLALVEAENYKKGRLRVRRCPTCGKTREVWFARYKKPGPPKGTKRTPEQRARRLGMRQLTDFKEKRET